MKVLGVACPRCGAPTRVSLASPDAVRCASCGYRGPPEPEAHRALYAAREVLASLDQRQLRITGLQRGVVIGSVGGLGAVGVLFAVVVLVMGFASGVGVALAVWKESLRLGLLFGLPWLLYIVAGVLGLVALRRRLSSARLACSAVAPDTPGGPCGCRVCGADLPAPPSSRSAVIACSYCTTDNLVDEASMRRAGATREYVLSNHESVVRGAASTVGAHVAAGILGVFLLAILSAYAGCVVSAKVGELEDATKIAAPDHRYALVQTGSGACVATISELDERGTGRLKFGHPTPKGAQPWYSRQPSLARYPAFSADSLIGRTAVLRRGGDEPGPRGVIERVYALRGNPNEALVVLSPDPGQEQPIRLLALCIENPSGLQIRAIENE